MSLLGEPRRVYSDRCEGVELPSLRARMRTESVGPFRVTGLDVAVESLRRVMARIEAADRSLYQSLGSMGMLCCRKIRGGSRPSRHSWGIAIDLTCESKLHHLGVPGVQRGLLACYRHFRDEGWYWGAGFSRNDPMHFEIGAAEIERLVRGGGR